MIKHAEYISNELLRPGRLVGDRLTLIKRSYVRMADGEDGGLMLLDDTVHFGTSRRVVPLRTAHNVLDHRPSQCHFNFRAATIGVQECTHLLIIHSISLLVLCSLYTHHHHQHRIPCNS